MTGADDLQRNLEELLRLVQEQRSYRPDPLMLPSWLQVHDDPEPRVLLCRPEHAEAWKVIIMLAGLDKYFTVLTDRHGLVKPGEMFLIRPGTWRPAEADPPSLVPRFLGLDPTRVETRTFLHRGGW